MEEGNENAVAADHISELPEPLLHYILSFIPIKYAARTSILSKRWNSIWITFPYLNFGKDFLDELIWFETHDYDSNETKKIMRLLKVATKIILSRCRQLGSIEKLCLTIPHHEISRKIGCLLVRKMQRLISCVANSGVKELNLNIVTFGFSFHDLPSTILSAQSMKVLSLVGFDLLSLSFLDIKFPSLHKLVLGNVLVEDGIIRKLIMGCPLMENLELFYCEGLKTLYLTGLLKLKLLDVHCSSSLEILQIEAPYLQVLSITGSCKVNVVTCSCLRKLMLFGGFVTEEWFYSLISKCRSLEDLWLDAEAFDNIKISSNTLKTFKLQLLHKSVVADITAPNLQKFHFQSTWLSTILINASKLLEIELQFYHQDVNELWHDQLAKFLEYFNHFNSVKLSGYSEEVIVIPKEKRDIRLSPLYGTGNLIFSAPSMKSEIVELVEYMLWLSPRPETLSIISMDTEYREKTDTVLKFQYEKNVCKDSSSPCCKFLPVDCWRHCIAEVKVENFEGTEDGRRKMKDFLNPVKDLKIEGISSTFNSLCGGLYSDYDKLFS